MFYFKVLRTVTAGGMRDFLSVSMIDRWMWVDKLVSYGLDVWVYRWVDWCQDSLGDKYKDRWMDEWIDVDRQMV